MAGSWQFNLTPKFVQQLVDQGFRYVGYYEILEGSVCKICVDEETGRWKFSVYTHVSYADGGKHVRIGKSEGLLRDRLKSWPRYIGDALKFTAPKNQQFKGGTPPWEAQGWVEYTVPYGRGLLFALRVENLPTLEETKKALRHLEKQLQDRYDPPLCNDTVAGRKLRDKWVRNHGWPVVIKKSEAVMTTIKTRICVAPDGTLTGRASGLPPGEHEAEIALLETVRGAARPDADTLLARVHAIQEEMAQLPVLDRRNPDKIIGYNQRGHFD